MNAERFISRGKRLDNGEWVQGFYADRGEDFKDNCRHLILVSSDRIVGDFEKIEVNPATIGQCTGIAARKSYRGERPEDLLIFEGDIVKAGRGIHEIVYKNCCLYAKIKKDDATYYLDIVNLAEKYKAGIRIIGNIHDNPELLEVNTDE